LVLQETINEIVDGFLSGGTAKTRAIELYVDNFDLDEIQSEALRAGLLVPNWWLEIDRDKPELLEGLLSARRIEELESGAEPTPEERERYRALRLSQIEDGDIDADDIPAFWIHRIVDSRGDDLYALTTARGYSFNGVESGFHGLFLWEKDCFDYLNMRGVVFGAECEDEARRTLADHFGARYQATGQLGA
jgi:hypothetical protein